MRLFGLDEIELELLGERLGERVAAHGNVAQPDGFAVGDDQVGIFGTDVDHHHAAVDALVVVHGVVDRQRIHLHDLDVHVHVGVILDDRPHQVFAHGKDADFDIRRIGVLEELVGPLHVLQGEGNLLDGLEADDFGDFLGFDRRQLDKPGEARLPADAHGKNAVL